MLHITQELIQTLSQRTLLAADVGPIVTILILLFSGISWVMQQLAENKKAKPLGRAKGLPAQQAQELQDFLRRARQRQGQDQQARGGREQVDQLDEVFEIVEERPAPKPRPQRPPKRTQPKPRKDAFQPKAHPQPTAKPVVAQVSPSDYESTVRAEVKSTVGQSQLSHIHEHLTSYMDENRMRQQIEKDLPHLTGTVKSDRTADEEYESNDELIKQRKQTSQDFRNSLVAVFRDPTDIKRAIIVSEILQKPRSLRKSS